MAINIILNSLLISLKERSVIGKGSTDSIFEIGRLVNCGNYAAKVCALVNSDITKKFLVDEENHPELIIM